ncbi:MULTISPECIES: VanZ family protein [Cupriavidus]|uniref:VanZ family protein n=1 Tax=Cupriavidus pauculus TaxID=82633 RepID=A0A5P2H132_9BURK|nr:VanZ family protein [Cupriavidus pauculus]QET01444.1 VanZ family protein [Cupriavidus pauculus]
MTTTLRSIGMFRLMFWGCAAAILVLALLPPSTPMPTTGWDKSNHMLAFGTLAVLGSRAWPGRMWGILLGLIAYGVLIEILQSLTPYRDADAIDVVADTIGALIGFGVNALMARFGARSA